jgi:hypothetical protein
MKTKMVVVTSARYYSVAQLESFMPHDFETIAAANIAAFEKVLWHELRGAQNTSYIGAFEVLGTRIHGR